MRDDFKPERFPGRFDQQRDRCCDLIFRTAKSGREWLPDRRTELGDGFGE